MQTPVKNLFLMLTLMAGIAQIHAQTTALTYQGRLNNNGADT
jgi:hypothetical protein